MVCKLLLHPALCLRAELPAPELCKWKQSLSMRWQKDFQELEKLLGSYIGMGSGWKCPRQFWLLTSHPLSILLPAPSERDCACRALAWGHKSPAEASAPRAVGVSKTVAFESEKEGKAVSRGNKQLIQGFEQSIEVRKPKALWRRALLEAVHRKDCCFASSRLSKMSLLCNLNSCWPSHILHIWEDWKILFQSI